MRRAFLLGLITMTLLASPYLAAQTAPPIAPSGYSAVIIDGYLVGAVDGALRVEQRLDLPELPPSVAALESGDEIAAINGRVVATLEELRTAYHAIEAGSAVVLSIRRAGQEVAITFTRPPPMSGRTIVPAGQAPASPRAIPRTPSSRPIESGAAPVLLSRVGPGFEVYAPTEEGLDRAVQGVEQAARAYRRHFGEPAPPIALVTYDAPEQLAGNEEERFRERGMVVQRWPASGPDLRQPEGEPATVEGLQRALASGRRVPTTATTLAHEVMHALTGARIGYVPAWFSEGVAALSEFPEGQKRYWDLLAEHLDQRIPWDRLFTMPHPAQSATVLGASHGSGRLLMPGGRTDGPVLMQRRSDNWEGALLYAQSMAMLAFLAEREGPLFVGEVARQLAAGTTMEAILASAPNVPGDLAELDRQWVSWVRDRIAQSPR